MSFSVRSNVTFVSPARALSKHSREICLRRQELNSKIGGDRRKLRDIEDGEGGKTRGRLKGLRLKERNTERRDALNNNVLSKSDSFRKL